MSEPAFTPGWTPGPWPLDYVSEAVRHIARNCDWLESETVPEFTWDKYADSSLIAAAPSLYGALEALVNAEGDLHAGLMEGSVLTNARAALALARGELDEGAAES